MAETTPRHSLPLLQPGQAQKEVTHNEALATIDTLLHLSVATLGDAEPPVSPAVGTSWIIGATPTGLWAGKAGMIATHDEAGWSFRTPVDGHLAWVAAASAHALFRDGAWHVDAWAVRSLQVRGRMMLDAEPPQLSTVSGGTVIDVEARLAIDGLVNALRTMGLVAEV